MVILTASKLAERVARTEEKLTAYDKQAVRCIKTFDDIADKLEKINSEQGETRDALKETRDALNNVQSEVINFIKETVKPPMSGKDKALLYGTAITSGCTLIGLIITGYVTYLSSLVH